MGRHSIDWLVAAVIANFCALICLTWLFITLSRNLAPSHQSRLFPRQLRSFAAAAFISAVAGAPVLWLDIWNFQYIDPSVLAFVCGPVFLVFRTFRVVSILQEAHIAVTFFVQIVRWTSTLPVLNWGIPVVWLSGLVIGALEAWIFRWHFKEGFCMEERVDWLSIVTVMVCLLIALVACIAAVITSLRGSAPGSVRRQNFKRAAAYPLVATLTFPPMLVAYIHIQLFVDPPWYFPFACCLECLNGILTPLAYALQSRVASSLQQGTATTATANARLRGETADFASFHVDFGGVDTVDLISVVRTDLGSTESGHS